MALIGDRKDHAARSNGRSDLGGASRRDGGSYVHGREEINRFLEQFEASCDPTPDPGW